MADFKSLGDKLPPHAVTAEKMIKPVKRAAEALLDILGRDISVSVNGVHVFLTMGDEFYSVHANPSNPYKPEYTMNKYPQWRAPETVGAGSLTKILQVIGQFAEYHNPDHATEIGVKINDAINNAGAKPSYKPIQNMGM
jgi:hypothetical protein